MPIVLQSAHVSLTLSPLFPLLPAPHKRLALPAPKIAGYLPAATAFAAGATLETPRQRAKSVSSAVVVSPVKQEKRERRVVEAEIANPLLLINIYKEPDAWWAEFERIHGRIQTIEEMDAEIEAKVPGYLAWVARMNAKAEMEAEAARS